MIEIIPNWHPIFVHFTVAILSLIGLIQLGLFVLSASTLKTSLEHTQKWLVGFGVLAVIATVTTGLLAYYSVNHDTPSHVAMTDHRNWALFTATLFIVCSALFVIKNKGTENFARLGFVLVTALVTVTAFKGGELVYRHGLGVMSMPQVTGEGHAHEHADGQEHEGASADDMAMETDEEMNNAMSDTSHSNEDAGHGHDDVPADAEPEQAAPVAHGHDNSDGHHDKKDPMMFSGQDSEAGKLVTEFHHALESGDASRVRELLDDNILIFEGGGVERSADQYASHHMISDMAFLKAIDIKVLEQQVKVHGDSAVAMSRSKMNGNYKGKHIDVDSMETMVLHKQNGQWKIVHLHWSNK